MKTVVLTPFGPYKYKRLPMGLKNSGQSFQRLMNCVLDGIEGVFVYLDDILLYNKSIVKVLQKLEENGLTINLKKCQFNKTQIDFLGYRVNGRGITPLPRKLIAIADYPAPSKPKQLLGFLGAINSGVFFTKGICARNIFKS